MNPSNMKIAELNGFSAHLPLSGGKAGKGHQKTGAIQVRRENLIVKQFRFVWDEKSSRLKAIRSAKLYMSLTCQLRSTLLCPPPHHR
jgi:hypothetical protein